MGDDLIAPESIGCNLVLAAAEAVVPAYPVMLASFCMSSHLHSLNGALAIETNTIYTLELLTNFQDAQQLIPASW